MDGIDHSKETASALRLPGQAAQEYDEGDGLSWPNKQST